MSSGRNDYRLLAAEALAEAAAAAARGGRYVVDEAKPSKWARFQEKFLKPIAKFARPVGWNAACTALSDIGTPVIWNLTFGKIPGLNKEILKLTHDVYKELNKYVSAKTITHALDGLWMSRSFFTYKWVLNLTNPNEANINAEENANSTRCKKTGKVVFVFVVATGASLFVGYVFRKATVAFGSAPEMGMGAPLEPLIPNADLPFIQSFAPQLYDLLPNLKINNDNVNFFGKLAAGSTPALARVIIKNAPAAAQLAKNGLFKIASKIKERCCAPRAENRSLPLM